MLGIIPRSMATPGCVGRGKGNEQSLLSARHGMGRKMSRTVAKEQFTWSAARKFLEDQNIELIPAGLDGVPMTYKDIETVMTALADLVEPIACVEPRLEKMAPPGERPVD
jgi:tRNA-splicing ligase RtcB